jgi:glyoxylase-like metal-dependent hydrolase (beta-lactamase superfamily II)
MTGTWTLYPLNYGVLEDFEHSVFVWLKHFGERLDAPCTGWLLIEDSGRCILVDCGPPEPEKALRYHHMKLRDSGPGVVANELARCGLATEAISDVVLTHLHWDHCSNVGLFPRARFYVQARELAFAQNPLPVSRLPYDVGLDFVPAWRSIVDRMELLDGDAEIRDGVSCHLTPGHTPGSQAISVRTEGRRFVIAGDNVDLRENWVGDETWKHRPGAIFVDLREYIASLERLESLGDVVLPSHDTCVFDRASYRR